MAPAAMLPWTLSALAALQLSAAWQPKWKPTWEMAKSTIFMPCNDSGFLDPAISAQWGIVDFDWSNGKGMWTKQQPMDCEERLVAQAELVKGKNAEAKVWVYRNLVKALPWYSSVREKITDPSYSGFFLKFKEGGSNGTNKWHMDPCTNSSVGAQHKCSEFYHDQEQTPVNGPAHTGPTKSPDGWLVWNPYNGVGGNLVHCDLSNTSAACQVWVPPDGSKWGEPHPTWENCSKAADEAMKINPLIHLWTWWKDPNGAGACWLSPRIFPGTGGPEKGHVMGYKGPAAGTPQINPSADYNRCVGDCNCGEGLPCGEYLWDHRNGTMLRQFLVEEFILNPKTGLGNSAISGFYFDDGWTNKPSPVPSWAPPTYRQCDMWKTGGATEEDYYCVEDMGLTQADVTQLQQEHDKTMSAVYSAVVENHGFVFQLLNSRKASLDLTDPRPPEKCKAYLRSQCRPAMATANETLIFEFTRKTFHASFPLPYVVEDVAQFLLVRQEYAYIGYSWMGCIQPNGFVQGNAPGWEGYPRPKELEVDYGVPVDTICSETAIGSGIFSRKWSKAEVSMDCNEFKGTITMT